MGVHAGGVTVAACGGRDSSKPGLSIRLAIKDELAVADKNSNDFSCFCQFDEAFRAKSKKMMKIKTINFEKRLVI